MSFSLLLVIIGVILAVSSIMLWLILRKPSSKKASDAAKDSIVAKAETDVEHVFNEEFREELRNRGRLHFEKIISENAMFLQQDLRLTTSQLNDFMKSEITSVLQAEFAKYEASINDAKQIAIDSINETQKTIDQQRDLLTKQLTEQLAREKERAMYRFEKHMADIVNHYVLEAVGEQIDLSEQLDFILSQMEQNKEAITRDIRDGA